MLTQTHEERIKALYTEYQENIKPLTFYVERKFHKFPKALLKEFRDVFDHIARCYQDGIDIAYIEENLKKAENHFDRIKLDTYKYVSDYKKREFTRWKKKYSKYDLQNINDGKFWESVLQLEHEGEKIFSNARKEESKNIERSCEMLQESTAKYDEIQQLIEKKKKLIIKAKFKYIKVSWGSRIVGFIVGVVASIIACIIWEVRDPVVDTFFELVKIVS